MLTTVEYLSLLREYMRKNSAKYGISRMGDIWLRCSW